MPAPATSTRVFDRLQPHERASVLDVLPRRHAGLDLALHDLAGRAGHRWYFAPAATASIIRRGVGRDVARTYLRFGAGGSHVSAQ